MWWTIFTISQWNPLLTEKLNSLQANLRESFRWDSWQKLMQLSWQKYSRKTTPSYRETFELRKIHHRFQCYLFMYSNMHNFFGSFLGIYTATALAMVRPVLKNISHGDRFFANRHGQLVKDGSTMAFLWLIRQLQMANFWLFAIVYNQ